MDTANITDEINDYPILITEKNLKYLLLQKLGTGATCKVYLGQQINLENNSLTNIYHAIKILKKSYSNNIGNNCNDEIEILSKFNHPNIINIVEGGICEISKICDGDQKTKNKNFLILELASNGELFDFIFYAGKGLGEKMARPLFIQLIEGIENCHENLVAHRDLKTENLMMDDKWKLKIADFGFAKIFKDNNNKLKTVLGTKGYIAPEILKRLSYDGKAADIFSCGIILFILVTGIPPMHLANTKDPYYKFFCTNDENDKKIFWEKLLKYTGKLSDEFKDLFSSIINPEPKFRPTANEILNHKWIINGQIPTYEEYFNEFEGRKLMVIKGKQIEADKEAKNVTTNTNNQYRSDLENYEELLFKENEDLEIKDVKGDKCIDKLNYKKNCILFKNSNYVEILNNLMNYYLKDETVKQVKKVKNLAKFYVNIERNIECDGEGVNENINKNNYNNSNDLQVGSTNDELEFYSKDVLKIEIQLERIDNENYVANFEKLEGDKISFYNEFKKISEYFKSD